MNIKFQSLPAQFDMKKISHIPIEHIVVTSHKPYEEVNASLLDRVSSGGQLNKLIQQLLEQNISWQQSRHEIEKQLGTSGFHIFCTIEHGQLLALAQKPTKIVQYTIGNPLIALQMTQHVAAAALYAPFKLVLYENEDGAATITYDRLTSCLSQFQNEEVIRVARHVDALLEDLIAAII
jgi:uncharacterized protein (DUF302 family)